MYQVFQKEKYVLFINTSWKSKLSGENLNFSYSNRIDSLWSWSLNHCLLGKCCWIALRSMLSEHTLIVGASLKITVLVSLAFPYKIPQTVCLQQQKFLFSQFGRLEVCNQGVIIVGFWWRPSCWLAEGPLLTLSPHSTRSEGERKLSGVSSYESIKLIMKFSFIFSF